jgi:adenosylcobyric acid synthase
VDLVLVKPGAALPGDAALVILIGSKASIADLAALRQAGFDIDIAAHVRRGGRVLGLCGGYQMLGRTIADPHGIEGHASSVAGLGLLDVATVLQPAKILREARGRDALGEGDVAGYEMHMGRTEGPDAARPMLALDSGPDGARDASGRIAGCYLHGLFSSASFRKAWLDPLRAARGLATAPAGSDWDASVDATLDELAAHLERCLDLDRLLAMASAERRAQP